jgi:hypothetical protein
VWNLPAELEKAVQAHLAGQTLQILTQTWCRLVPSRGKG